MPEKYVSETLCDARHKGTTGRQFLIFGSALGVFLLIATYAVVGSNGAQRTIDLHVVEDERGDEAIQQSLQNIEARQIRQGDRIDSIYDRVGP